MSCQPVVDVDTRVLTPLKGELRAIDPRTLILRWSVGLDYVILCRQGIPELVDFCFGLHLCDLSLELDAVFERDRSLYGRLSNDLC